MSQFNEVKIVNLYHHKKYIGQVADWIYSEFMREKIELCTLEDIISILKNREEYEIPMTYIALSGAECMGTISLFKNDLKMQKELTPWLAALYVDEEYRKNGYAKLLIDKIYQETKRLKLNKLYLRTETAGNYYLKHGWSELYKAIDEYGIYTTVYEMSLI